MSWIRNTTEPAERRSLDVARLILCGLALVVLGVWSQSQSAIDINFFAPINDLAGNMVGVAKGIFALGSPWAALAVVLVLLLLRAPTAALRVGIAAGSAWGLAELLNEILGTHAISGAHVNVRIGDGPVFPVVNVAIITALAAALSPFAVRGLRRLFGLAVILVSLAAMYLGAGLPSDVFGGILLGLTTAAAVLVAFGSPAGKPSIDEVRDALTSLGYDVADIRRAEELVPRAAVMDVSTTTGEHYRVDVFGRDQRDAQVAAKAWHRLMYKEPGLPVFGSRMQYVEHIGYALMLADRAGVHVPTVVKTGEGGADAAVLVTAPLTGTPLADLGDDAITDDVLAATWREVQELHKAGISHGNLDPLRIVVNDGQVALDDFSAADATGQQQWIDRDVAAVLVASALRVGNDRAIGAAVKALGSDRVAAVLPMVQPAAVPTTTTKGVKQLGKTLKALRDDAAKATGSDPVKPLEIRRLTLANIGITAGVLLALVIAISSLEGVNWSSVRGQFEDATWGWVLLAAALYPLVPMAWATALMGCVNADLPFVPTVITQVSCNFLNLITPNGIGGTALQIDYLHKQGVPVASGGSAMVLSSGVAGAMQMGLFLLGAAITATAIQTSDSSTSNASLWVIALGAALIGIVLAIPKIRGKVVPAVKRAASDIWAVLRNPRKAMQLFGGDLAGNLIYPALLGLCLLAFHQRLDYAQLIVVQVGSGMISNVAPVPGGIGVQEAALTAGLTSFGVPATPALAAVLVYRGITFALPAFTGFFTLRWLRARGYA
jgi:glycosyltransferase 2 family protein